MAFIRIENAKDGRAIAKDVSVPDDIRESEGVRAQAILDEKAKGRQMMYQELTPVYDLERPHPKSPAQVAPEAGAATKGKKAEA